MGFLARGSLFFNEKTRLTCVCAFFVVTSRAPTSFVHAHSSTSKLQLRYAAHTQNPLEIFTKTFAPCHLLYNTSFSSELE